MTDASGTAMHTLVESLRRHPVIAAVHDEAGAHTAAASATCAVFVLGGTLQTLPGIIKILHGAAKTVFVHIDLMEGLSGDASAVKWLSDYAGVDGLISTRAPIIRLAKEMHLLTVQRLFLMDSASFTRGVRMLGSHSPDMAEVLPGLVPKAIKKLCSAIHSPVIAGGMVTEMREVALALQAGALAVSTSEDSLWNLEND